MLRSLRIALITDPLAAFCVLMMGISVVVASWFSPTRTAVHKAARFWSRILLFTSGVRLTVHGEENTPRGIGAVFVANHQSMLDIPTLMLSVPRTILFLAKESLFRFPFIGWYLRTGRHISVLREDKRSSVKALVEARKKLNDGHAMLVFPEGTRSNEGIREFKSGAAHLAIKAGVPLVPVGVWGTGARLPKNSIHIRSGAIVVRIGKPVETTGLTPRDADRLTEVLHDRVARLLEASSPRI